MSVRMSVSPSIHIVALVATIVDMLRFGQKYSNTLMGCLCLPSQLTIHNRHYSISVNPTCSSSSSVGSSSLTHDSCHIQCQRPTVRELHGFRNSKNILIPSNNNVQQHNTSQQHWLWLHAPCWMQKLLINY